MLLPAILILALAAPSQAQPPAAGQVDVSAGSRQSSDSVSVLQSVGFDQNLDAQVPLDLTFQDEQGRDVRLAEIFGDRPIVLTLVYYRCPMLCSQVLNGLVRSLRPLSIEPGKDFDIVTVSIDPEDTPYLASRKKESYIEEYGRPGAAAGWHFLTGEEDQIRRLASTVGFRYTYNPVTKLYAHAAGIVVLTPGGRVSRYLYGVDFPPRDLQFSLLESSTGTIGSPIRKVLLLCYNYDAAAGKYTLSIVRVTQVLGVATVLTLAGAVVLMLLWERRRNRRLAELPEPSSTEST